MKKLTESEEMVMKAVWDLGKAPVLAEVSDRINEFYKKEWKPQTVSTYLQRLVYKKYLKLCRNGRIYTYKVLHSEAEYRNDRLQSIYDYLYKGDKEALMQDVEEIML